MTQWLLERLIEHEDHPNPRFAFQGTVNWMRALAISCHAGSWEHQNLRSNFAHVSRRTPNREADTAALSNLLMAIHNQATLNTLNNQQDSAYNICRLAIIAWYYSIYFSASAMVEACSGQSHETHSETAKAWGADIVNANLALPPFDLKLSGIVPSYVNTQVSQLRAGNNFDLNNEPTSISEALGAQISYLKGTAEFEQWKTEEKIRQSREFRALGVTNFRTAAARLIRDQRLSQRGINFLVQAFRYRGKANYRDSIFLSYGPDYSERIVQFVSDMTAVSSCFQSMAAAYISKRIETGVWQEFSDDIGRNLRIEIDLSYIGA